MSDAERSEEGRRRARPREHPSHLETGGSVRHSIPISHSTNNRRPNSQLSNIHAGSGSNQDSRSELAREQGSGDAHAHGTGRDRHQ